MLSAFSRGDVHTSTKDQKLRATMVLKDNEGKRITSAHVYHDEEVTFSKDQFDTEDLVMLQSGLVWFLDKILEP
jgi:hypothetical protein